MWTLLAALVAPVGCADPCVDDGLGQSHCPDTAGQASATGTSSTTDDTTVSTSISTGDTSVSTSGASMSASASGSTSSTSGTTGEPTTTSPGTDSSTSTASTTTGVTATDSGTTGGSTDDGGTTMMVTATGTTTTTTTTTSATSTTGTDTGGAIEICDGVDNDGDGAIDEFSEVNADCNGCTLEQFQDHAYWFCGDLLTWPEARDTCETFGATLTSVESAAENAFIATHLLGQESEELWLGGSDLAQEGTFAWEDGQPFIYENWAFGEPNDSGGQDCIQMYGFGRWDDDNCDETRRFMCKVPHTP